MRYVFLCSCCYLLAGTSFSEDLRPDWHTGDYPGRNPAMWKVISDDLKTSFPRGGAPVEVKPFLQDDRLILTLPEGSANAARGIDARGRKAGRDSADARRSVLFQRQLAGPDIGENERRDRDIQRRNHSRSRTVASCDLNQQRRFPFLISAGTACPTTMSATSRISPDGELYVATASGIGILSKERKMAASDRPRRADCRSKT